MFDIFNCSPKWSHTVGGICSGKTQGYWGIHLVATRSNNVLSVVELFARLSFSLFQVEPSHFAVKMKTEWIFAPPVSFPQFTKKSDKTTLCAGIIIIRQQSPFSKTKKSPASSSQALFVSAILSALCAPLLFRILQALRFSIHPISEGLQINREIFLHIVFQLINELVGHDGCVGAIAYGCGYLTDTGVSHVTGGKHPGNIGFPVLIDLNVTPIV